MPRPASVSVSPHTTLGCYVGTAAEVLNPTTRPRGHPDDPVGGRRVAISKELEVLARGVGRTMGRGRVGTSWGPHATRGGHDACLHAQLAPGSSPPHPEDALDSHSWGARGRRFKSCRPDWRQSWIRAGSGAIRNRPSVVPDGQSFSVSSSWTVAMNGSVLCTRRVHIAASAVPVSGRKPRNNCWPSVAPAWKQTGPCADGWRNQVSVCVWACPSPRRSSGCRTSEKAAAAWARGRRRCREVRFQEREQVRGRRPDGSGGVEAAGVQRGQRAAVAPVPHGVAVQRARAQSRVVQAERVQHLRAEQRLPRRSGGGGQGVTEDGDREVRVVPAGTRPVARAGTEEGPDDAVGRVAAVRRGRPPGQRLRVEIHAAARAGPRCG